MTRILIFILLLVPLSSFGVEIKDCTLKYIEAKKLLEQYYIDETFRTKHLEELYALLKVTDSCSDKIWNLRLKTMELYLFLFSPEIKGEYILDKLATEWENYLNDNSFTITTMSQLEGFVEFLNSIRLQYKILNDNTRISIGEDIQKLQFYYSKKALESNSTHKWVLNNQHFNSHLNYLHHANKYGDLKTYCSHMHGLNQFVISNKDNFTSQQLETVNKRYGQKFTDSCK